MFAECFAKTTLPLYNHNFEQVLKIIYIILKLLQL